MELPLREREVEGERERVLSLSPSGWNLFYISLSSLLYLSFFFLKTLALQFTCAQTLHKHKQKKRRKYMYIINVGKTECPALLPLFFLLCNKLPHLVRERPCLFFTVNSKSESERCCCPPASV